MSDAPQKAICYVRVSSDDQAINGHGLESQESRCRQFAQARGYEVVAVFPDTFTGGGDYTNRPGMIALFSFVDAQPGENFVVVFDDVKRASRDTRAFLDLRDAFRKREIRVESPNFKFDDTPEGEFIETIIAAQGQLERKQNRRQVQQKMTARLNAGYWTFPAPCGYKFEKVAPHGKLLVRNEPLGSIVQEALEGYASGRFASQNEVKRYLESQPAFPNDRGFVHPQRVIELLSRVTYAGHIEYPRWGVTLRKGHHEGLVSLETFQKVQDRRKARGRIVTRKDLNPDFVLRGAVACADCGVTFKSCWSQGRAKRYAYYVCQTPGCASKGKSARRHKVHGAFEDFLQSLTPAPALFEAARAMFKDAWDMRVGNAEAQRKDFERKIHEMAKQSDKLMTRILDTDNDRMIRRYENEMAKLDKERAILEEKRETIGQPTPTYEECLEPALRFLTNPWKAWEKGSFTLRRTILKLVLTEPFHYHRTEGPRTPKIALPFKVLADFCTQNLDMVPGAGIHRLHTILKPRFLLDSIPFDGRLKGNKRNV